MNINNTQFTLKRVEQIEALKVLISKIQHLKHSNVMDIAKEIQKLNSMSKELTDFNNVTVEVSFIEFLERKAMEEYHGKEALKSLPITF
jgi:hypothetical protein